MIKLTWNNPFFTDLNHNGNLILITPGVNMLADDCEESIEKSAIISGNIKTGKAILSKSEVKLESDNIDDKLQAILDMDVSEAKDMIKEIFDKNFLLALKELDDRKSVKKAIAEQLDAIKLPEGPAELKD